MKELKTKVDYRDKYDYEYEMACNIFGEEEMFNITHESTGEGIDDYKEYECEIIVRRIENKNE